MFSKICTRLTLQYTSVMMLLLLGFIVVSYTGVFWILYREEQQDLQSIIEEEAREQAVMFKQQGVYFQLEAKDETDIPNTGAKIFYYVFDTNGNQVATEEPALELRANALKIIHDWDAQDGKVKLKKFYLPSGEMSVVIMCSMKIYDGNRILGTVFMGEDITDYYQTLKMLMIVMVTVALFFLLIAAFAGHSLAGRAIIPIKQSFSRQREFAADASHELRTPLSVLLTSVDAMQTDDENHLSPFSTQVLEDMKSEIRRMTKIVSDLLTLARADAGATNIITERFNLCAIVKQVVRTLQPMAIDKGIILELASSTNVCVVADRERIKQLLLILVDNAIKYTPSGGRVVILITTIAGPKPWVNITVRDTGVGIPEVQRDLIFERFYRVDKARLREEGGTGLGLAIAKWIVDSHGGEIKVESVPGVGSSFVVTMPM